MMRSVFGVETPDAVGSMMYVPVKPVLLPERVAPRAPAAPEMFVSMRTVPVPVMLAAMVRSALALVILRVVPVGTSTVVLAARRPLPRSSNVPLVRKVPPVCVLAPVRMRLPVPVLLRRTRPRPVAPLARVPA